MGYREKSRLDGRKLLAGRTILVVWLLSLNFLQTMKIRHIVLSNLVVMLISASEAGTVTSSADSGAGSLREALGAASNNDMIHFAPALNGATITLSSGSLGITGRTLTVDASALASGITISGGNSSRIFTITSNADVTLRSLQLRNGREDAGNGGGLYAISSHLVLDACSIHDCVSAYDGGGLWGNGITGSIQCCKIAGNQAGGFGGGAFLIGINGTHCLDIYSSQISGNLAQFGGGIYHILASPTLSNCSIQGNSGGGIRSEIYSNPILRNCIVWGNTMSSAAIAASQLNNTSDSHPDVASCLIEGASGADSFNDGSLVVWGRGNLDGSLPANNPGFVGAVSAGNAPSPAADLRVFTGSACLNSGNNDIGGASHDLAGTLRLQGSATNLGAFAGAYESFSHLYPTLDPAGDENRNGLVNFLEYALGIDPRGPGDAAALPVVSRMEGTVFLTSTRRSNGIDIEPLWMTSTHLDPSSWVPMIQGVDYLPESTSTLSADRQQVVFKLLVSDRTRFYRLGFATRN